MRLNCVNIRKMPGLPGLARTLWVQASGDVSARQRRFSVKILTNRG
jgi:hypothetical protein